MQNLLKTRALLPGIAFSIGLLAAGGTFAARPGQGTGLDPISLIEQDYQAGKLSGDERAIYAARAIRTPSVLPTAYQAAAAAPTKFVTRDLTLVLRDIKLNWKQLADSTQRIVSGLLTRWNTAFTIVSPGGFFRFHYDTTGANAVPTADANHNGIPDYVEKCEAYADSSLAKQLALGFAPPPSDGTAGGDSLYDVYFEEMPYYGYTQMENPGPAAWDDYTSYLVLNRNFIGFPPNHDPEGNVAGAAKVTCAHEFHHAIQYGYSGTQAEWYSEEDAVSMESQVYPKVNDNYNYLPTFFTSPQTSLLDSSGHEYSSFIWGLFLAEKFDTSFQVAVWQGARYSSVFQTVADTLLGRYGWTRDSAMAEFALWNYCTGIRNDGTHYRDAANYGPMTVGQTFSVYPVPYRPGPGTPAGYGTCYAEFPPENYKGQLRLTFQGDASKHWAAGLIKSTSNGAHQFEKLRLNQVTMTDTVTVPGFENYSMVTLAAVNLTPNSPPASFYLSAQILPESALRDSLSPDSALYSGASRQYTYKVWNTSASSQTVKLVHWDDAGWLLKDSISPSLLPGDSATFPASVHPPAKTAIGSKSKLHFRAVLLADSSQSIERDLPGTIFLYRGDVNFDGIIDLRDLSSLVSYLTVGQSPPQPVLQAGDFNCAGVVDLEDLSALVAFLTGGGYRCPCNPF